MSIRPADLLFVFIGGMVGALARVFIADLFSPLSDGLGLFIANVSGAVALAFISVLSARLAPHLRVFLGTGFCGSFTSVSTLNAFVLFLSMEGGAASAGWYLALSILLSLALVFWVLGWKRDAVSDGGDVS